MKKEWWRSAVGYQIYIRSFFDGNGDGIGDLVGITEKLEYIKNLGVDFIWINPFYDSPMDDNGYDVRNYYAVAKEYGDMDILKTLVNKAHSLGLRVVFDLVLNHTSAENEWFIKSENKIEPFTDFYVWKDGKKKGDKLLPPNNWVSFFSGPAWAYSEKRKQYYLRIFAESMPDVNYESETAFIEMEKVINYFGALGVDGFRVDAISHLGKDLTFLDAKDEGKTYKSFSNLENNHKYLKRFNKAFQRNNMVTMGELGGDPTEEDLIKYTTEKELDMIFSFEQMGVFTFDNKINRSELLKVLKYKEGLSSYSGWSVLFWLNHDYPRLVSKIRGEGDPVNAQVCLATLMYFLKGTPIIYNGEEIGMENYPFSSPEEFCDVNAIMMLNNASDKESAFSYLKESSRDHARTVMQWNSGRNAGFSSSKPWFHVNKNYKKVNVQAELEDSFSVLNNYISLLKARKSVCDILVDAEYEFFDDGGLIGYTAKVKGDKVVVVCNLSDVNKDYDFVDKETLYSNMEIGSSIKPYQVLVLKKKSI